MRFMMAMAMAALAAVCGCKTAGVAARVEQRKVVGVTSAQIGEYTIPVLSLSEGPSMAVYQSKEVPSTVELRGYAVTTNRTSALGIYSSEETKTFRFFGKFSLSGTNSATVVSSDR